MKPHQLRVVIEKAELDIKLAALNDFIKNSPISKTLPDAEQLRLSEQAQVMDEYSRILGNRIANFQ